MQNDSNGEKYVIVIARDEISIRALGIPNLGMSIVSHLIRTSKKNLKIPCLNEIVAVWRCFLWYYVVDNNKNVTLTETMNFE